VNTRCWESPASCGNTYGWVYLIVGNIGIGVFVIWALAVYGGRSATDGAV
jgi:hypothetical protein